MSTWRLLDTGRLSAAENMALDETLLEAKGPGIPDTIRFLQFSPPAALVGYNQSIAQEVRVDYCRQAGIDINRRITGGGAILFDQSQLGWEIICDKSFFNAGIATESLFSLLCRPVCKTLRRLGLDASFRPRNDIEIEGRKISGTGGTEHNSAFFFQGTLLVDFDIETMLRALRIPIEKLKSREIEHARERVTCLRWELGEAPGIDELKKILLECIGGEFGIAIEEGELLPRERALFREKKKKFSSMGYIDRIRLPKEDQPIVRSLHKSKGGLIRTYVMMNLKSRRIRSIFITGDFFAYPRRTIADLEASLRETRGDRQSIGEKVGRFFETGRYEIPGVTPEDLADAIMSAIAKTSVTRYGISLQESSHIFPVLGSFEEIISKSPRQLLLPYCAKSLECGYRLTRDCAECGNCTVGEAFRLGRAKGLEITTILSFEDLAATLAGLRSRNVSSYIGCCCEGFIRKHIDDFQSAGVPGILLDIDDTTCYELGKEQDAYKGVFENQTRVNIPLLEKVLNVEV